MYLLPSLLPSGVQAAGQQKLFWSYLLPSILGGCILQKPAWGQGAIAVAKACTGVMLYVCSLYGRILLDAGQG